MIFVNRRPISWKSADAGAANGDLSTTIILGRRAAALGLVARGRTVIDSVGSATGDLLEHDGQCVLWSMREGISLSNERMTAGRANVEGRKIDRCGRYDWEDHSQRRMFFSRFGQCDRAFQCRMRKVPQAMSPRQG
jgi:hypothetical protein